MQIKELKSGRLYLFPDTGDSKIAEKARKNTEQRGERVALHDGREVVVFPATERDVLQRVIANPVEAAWLPATKKGGKLRAGLIGVSPTFDAYMAEQSAVVKGDWEYIFPAEHEPIFKAAWIAMASDTYAPKPFYNRIHEQLLERERSAVEYDRFGFSKPED